MPSWGSRPLRCSSVAVRRHRGSQPAKTTRFPESNPLPDATRRIGVTARPGFVGCPSALFAHHGPRLPGVFHPSGILEVIPSEVDLVLSRTPFGWPCPSVPWRVASPCPVAFRRWTRRGWGEWAGVQAGRTRMSQVARSNQLFRDRTLCVAVSRTARSRRRASGRSSEERHPGGSRFRRSSSRPRARKTACDGNGQICVDSRVWAARAAAIGEPVSRRPLGLR